MGMMEQMKKFMGKEDIKNMICYISITEKISLEEVWYVL